MIFDRISRLERANDLRIGVFFIEPRFLKEKQPQKPHNKLEKAQMMLRENKLNLELKLGGESDNPTSKGIPQPPLWRKSIRGA